MKRTFLSAIVTVLIASIANAQNPRATSLPPTPPLQGIIVGEQAYLVQNPEMIIAGDVRSVTFSPDSQLIIAAREVRAATAASLLGKPENAPAEATLSVWKTRTRRSVVVWRRDLPPGEKATFFLRGWMGKTGFALGSVVLQSNHSGEKGKSTHTFLAVIIDTTSGASREITIPPDMHWFPRLSPTQPFAILVRPDGAIEGEVRFLRSDGTISAPVATLGLISGSWSDDGTVFRGLLQRDKAQENVEPDWYAFSPTAMAVTKIPPPPKKPNGESDYSAADKIQENLPLQLVGRNGAKGIAPEVWLELREDSKQAVRLTPSGYPIGILPDLSAALYHSQGGLYIVPLLTVEKALLPLPKQQKN